MRILVINQYYAPDKASSGLLLTSLCEGLAEKGIIVDVLCGKPSYTDDAPDALSNEEKTNLIIKRVSTFGAKGRLGIRKRILGYLGFLICSAYAIITDYRKINYDIVLTFSNPPFVGLIGVLAKRIKKAKFIYVLHDVHPDILLLTGRIKEGVISKVWDGINKIILRGADKIVVLGSKMAESLSNNKNIPLSKISVIHNWPLIGINTSNKEDEFRLKYNLKKSFVVLYAGNMGVSHNLEWLTSAAYSLKYQEIIFVFIGEGEKKRHLQKYVDKEGLDKIIFLPYQNDEAYKTALLSADICVVALEPELAGLAVPSKTYTIFAAGRPILLLSSGDDDVAQTVREYECGWVAQNEDDVSQILNDIINEKDLIDLYGIRARNAYKKAFTKEKSLQAYYDLFVEVIGE